MNPSLPTVPSLHVLTRCAAWLDGAHIPYVVVGDSRGYPDTIRGDVDIVMSDADLRRFRRQIHAMATACGLRVVQCFQHEFCAFYFVLTDRDRPDAPYLRLDLCSDYLRGGRRLIPAAALLSARKPNDLGPPETGLWLPDDPAAFLYYLVKKADKGKVDALSFDYLALLANRSQASIAARVSAALGDEVADRVVQALARDVAALRDVLPTVARALHARHPVRPLDRLRDVARRAVRLLRPTGLVVAVLGPDGSGKSAVLARLQERLLPAFRLVRRAHFRPQFGGYPEEPGRVVANPHAQPPRGMVASVAKLLFYAVDYTVGIARMFFACTVRSGLLLFDRYAFDIEVDPRRYRYGGPLWAARLLGRIVPQPDVTLVLTGDPEVIWRRKREVSLEEMVRLCAAYRQLAERRGWTLLDAAAPLADVVEKAEGVVLCHLERRLARRMGWANARRNPDG